MAGARGRLSRARPDKKGVFRRPRWVPSPPAKIVVWRLAGNSRPNATRGRDGSACRCGSVPNSVFCARRLSPLVRLLAVAEPAIRSGSRRGA